MRLYSPQMLLVKPDQIEVAGNHIVPREEVLKLFVHDRNRSVLRIPLDDRRAQIQELAWVEEASVQRILPNHLRIEISERAPIAFFRNAPELVLVDAHGGCSTGRRARTSTSPSLPDFRKACRAKSAKSACRRTRNS